MLWKGVPSYRALLSADMPPGTARILWSLTVVALIQPAYWLGWRATPPVEAGGAWRNFLGHIVLFLGRMTFVFVGAVITTVFYVQPTHLQITPYRVLQLMALLFSMFCYILELEKLGNALIREADKK